MKTEGVILDLNPATRSLTPPLIEGFVYPQNANGLFMDLNDKNRLYECIDGQLNLVKTIDCTEAFTFNPTKNSYCEGKTFFHRF